MAGPSYSIVEYYPGISKDRCGYCNRRYISGMDAITMEVEDYQALLDRGWRRSGCYYYKPRMDQTCCPSYPINCEALNFKISKSQKKILKKMGKFLRNELHKDDMMDTREADRNNIDIENPRFHKHPRKTDASSINIKAIHDEVNVGSQLISSENEKESNSIIQQEPSQSIPQATSQSENTQTTSRSLESVEMNPNRTFCKKAKLIRIERKKAKLLTQGKSQEEIDAMFKKENKQQNQGKSVEELFDEVFSASNRLKVTLVRTWPMSSQYLSTEKKSHEVYKKYQRIIHGDPEAKLTLDRYKEFLVISHLQPWIPENGPPNGYGAFHQQYWLDDELIAVGVIDILPFCVSSVYFYYDPAYSFLSLGTFSSLHEVCLTRQLNKTAKDLQYYCMGFYINTCPKMRYKAKMKPSKLLCPETYKWFDAESCIKKLEKEIYCRFNDDIDAVDQDGIVDIKKVLILYKETIMPFRIYKERARLNGHPVSKEEEEHIKQYAILVGMKCAQRMLLLPYYLSLSISLS
ncbi:Arginyl-tRNA--protein transferase 1 [Dufourea novaeangliae]|uniref:Arginyl-tRNA--protein transferase 1 n=1 Tax=Dufourea novaeangliae TaxID=178035 RepID=A0A154P502_DUFNO|nr:Arginyl-tRNA--protein transferase 1 [Dufourea novaeangliae]